MTDQIRLNSDAQVAPIIQGQTWLINAFASFHSPTHKTCKLPVQVAHVNKGSEHNSVHCT